MLKFAPLLLLALIAYVNFKLSSWHLLRRLSENSTALDDFRLEVLVRKMAKTAGISNIRVRIFEVEAINGLATADGGIFLTRGFINKYHNGDVSAEELASVIAHELGHVAMGHSKNRLADVTASASVLWILRVLLGRLIPFIGPWIASFLAGAYRNRLSQINEYEADAYASALLIRTEISTEPQKSLFQKLEGLTASYGEKPAKWLRSHPTPEDRIAAIEANEAKWGVAGPRSQT